MASGLYSEGALGLQEHTIDLTSDVLKLMLVDDTYAYDPDHTFVDDGTANDPASHEISCTNYTGGFAGSGRKDVTGTLTQQYNATDNRTEIAVPDQTWTALGGVSNDTIGGAILYVHDTNDGASRLIAFFDLADTVTNGGDIVLDFLSLGAGGNIRLTL